MARPARSLDVLLNELDTACPNRSKISDGWLGDPVHAARLSDHNPNAEGVVRARDFTNDPAHGADMNIISENIRQLMLDGHPALQSGAYVIWDHEIVSFNRLGEGWRAYTGDNPHDHHMHVSVSTAPSGYDSTRPWGVVEEEDPMADYEAQIALIILQGEQSQRRDVALRQIVKEQGELLDVIADEVSTGNEEIKARITASRRKIEQAIAEADAADQ